MRVETATIPAMSLEEFADKHGLTMEIHEREVREGHTHRFYAHFKGCEVSKDGRFLVSVSGDGPTPEAAMADYAEQIDLKRLVIGAYTPNRREIPPHRIRAA